MKQVFDDAFDATSDTPKESLNLKFRADLMDRIVEQVDAEGWHQGERRNALG